MRNNITEDIKEYIEELKQAIKDDPSFADEIVKIEDQYMTAAEAIRQHAEGTMTKHNFRSYQKGSL